MHEESEESWKGDAIVRKTNHLELLEILSDKELMASLKKGIADVKAGRTISFEKIKKKYLCD